MNPSIQFGCQRVVIKVGSNLISPAGTGCRTQDLLAVAQFIIQLRENGKQVILVSSGSVAAGKNAIAHNRIATMAEKQAMAAVGQMRMMANWGRLFDFPCAQLLLTHQDMADRQRYLNAKNTLRELLDNDVLPIVNENDTVATEELKFGDNDNLAAQVALLSEADTLIICTDVDGVFDANPATHPQARLIPYIEQVSDDILRLGGQSSSSVGTGGMQTKLLAARKASGQGVQTIILNGKDQESFSALQQRKLSGTYIAPARSMASAKKHWLAQVLHAKGQVMVDDGAFRAIVNNGASLLPAGIIGVGGHFNSGEPVELVYDERVFARGLSAYNSAELQQIAGRQSQQISQLLGYQGADVALHRDDLVLL